MPRVLLIDDVDASAAQYSELGRVLLGPVAQQLRTRLLALAERRGWRVAPYSDFVRWASRLPAEGALWVVLDRLFPLAQAPGCVAFLDVHRAWKSSTAAGSLRYDVRGSLPSLRGASVILLDDAAYTGGTLKAAARTVEQAGGKVVRIAVYACRTEVLMDWPDGGAKARYRVPARTDILHLRDFFPFLPHSGRRLWNRAPLVSRPGPLEFRLAPFGVLGGAWLHLQTDTAGRAAVAEAAVQAERVLSDHLGRPAEVRDLRCLGGAVAIPMCKEFLPVRLRTSVASLLESAAGGPA